MSNYSYTLLDYNGEHYIEKNRSERITGSGTTKSENDRTKDVLTNNLHNQGRGSTRNKCLKGGGYGDVRESGMYGLRARIRKRKKASRRDDLARTLTVSHQIGLKANIGQKHGRLRDNAAGTTAACSSIDGSLRGGGFSLGGVIDDGEEQSEGIH